MWWMKSAGVGLVDLVAGRASSAAAPSARSRFDSSRVWKHRRNASCCLRYRSALFVPTASGQARRPAYYVATYGATSSTINPLGTCTNQPGSTGSVLAVAGYDDINNNRALILS
jgi:hypothetical protein